MGNSCGILACSLLKPKKVKEPKGETLSTVTSIPTEQDYFNKKTERKKSENETRVPSRKNSHTKMSKLLLEDINLMIEVDEYGVPFINHEIKIPKKKTKHFIFLH